MLTLSLNLTGLPALAIGTEPEGLEALRALAAAGARTKIVVPVASAELRALCATDPDHLDLWEDDYSRHYLTPRPHLIVLLTRDAALAAEVRKDAHHRGIVVIDVFAEEPGVGEGRIGSPPSPP